MKVLLLHPQDAFAQPLAMQRWDLVIDLGRAPIGTYERWSRQTGCPVVSLFDHAEEIEDLHRLRELLQRGSGLVVDKWGIDWWDVFSLEIASGLQRAMLVHRLAKDLPADCELYASRPDPAAGALQRRLGAKLTYLSGGWQQLRRRVRRYSEALWRLDKAELFQICEDKFDVDHSIRRHFAHLPANTGQPVVLLPSAYVNVSRTALSYAALFPSQQFMLVVARRSGYPATVPPNVRVASLNPYFGATDKRELASLLVSWDNLRTSLSAFPPEFEIAESEGLLERASVPFGWGIALRDAWLRYFASEHVTACLTADDSNPNTRIPLILAKRQGIPALACHHGAFDFRMAIKVNHADLYLAKSEMERDYLRRICHLAPEKVALAAPASRKPLRPRSGFGRSAPWLVFFTEPYQTFGWRGDEVYRDLLPRLWSLAQSCGLQLVFKLHPFESLKQYRRILRRYLPEEERQIEVLAGPPSDQLWHNARFALTVQSSAALECASMGIPVFLCTWLRDSYSGYVQQYARFGVGCALNSPEQIAEIPSLLRDQDEESAKSQTPRRAPDSYEWTRLDSGTLSMPVARGI